jgi:hypothetical protein
LWLELRFGCADYGDGEQQQQQLNGFGRSVALPGCLLSGSGDHPWSHSPPQAIHGLLSATPRQDAASASG